jgi:glutamate 5-kinase
VKLIEKKNSRIVIKIGSSLLVRDAKFRDKWLKNFVQDIAGLIEKKNQVIIVSSGAVALGRLILKKIDQAKFSMKEKKAAAAVGQVHLMSFYRDFFKKFNLNIAQILLTASDCNDRERYLSSKNTIETLLKNRVIPIINENDSVAVDEIKIGDNDRLAARISQMISADLMILLTDIDGLYNKNPKIDKNAKLIKEIFSITKEVESMAGDTSSRVGTGGMKTKIMAAKMVNDDSCDVLIAKGIEENSLKNLFLGKQNYTIFYGKNKNIKSRKKWLSGIINTENGVVVNQLAAKTLKSKKVSLLPIGVIGVKGNFIKGEIIAIYDENNIKIGNGISNYDASDVNKIMLKRSEEVVKIFGKNAKKEVIRIDNLSIFV